MNLNNLIVAMNIICYSGKLNPFDCYNLGLLYKKIYGHKLYLDQNSTDNKDKSNKENNVDQVDMESVNTEAQVENTESQVENTESQVENTEAQVENTEAQVENTEVQVENTEVQVENTEAQVENTEVQVENTEVQVENTEVQVENTEVQVENNGVKRSEIKIDLVETIDIEDLANIHNLLFTYSKIEGVYVDENKENIEKLLDEIKKVVENFLKKKD